MAVDEGCAPGPRAEYCRAGDASAAVQPAGAGDRMGDGACGDGREPRAAALESARRRLLSGKYKRGQWPSGATRLGEDPNRGMEAYDRRGTRRTRGVIRAGRKNAH